MDAEFRSLVHFEDHIHQMGRRILDLIKNNLRTKTYKLPKEADVSLDSVACGTSLVSTSNYSRAAPDQYPKHWQQCLRLQSGLEAVRLEMRNGECHNTYFFNDWTA